MAGGPHYHKKAQGVAFQADFSQIGNKSDNVFSGASRPGVLDEERQHIEKVFSIVDKDSSGSIDTKELEEMFKIFGVDTHYLMSAIQRIMSNVDKDNDGSISPEEFYKLLSQKFEPTSPVEEIKSVFQRMDRQPKDDKLDIDELAEVAAMLGENLPREEIKAMVSMFSQDYQTELKKFEKKKKQAEKQKTTEKLKEPQEPTFLTLPDFIAVMHESLED